MYLRTSFILLALTITILKVSAFTPNCTLPTANFNTVTGVGFRSTFDILWSSLFTIFACTWTIQHLNVPEQRNGRDPEIKGDLKWMRKRFLRSVSWMLLTIIAPEYTLGFAVAYLQGAWRSRGVFGPMAYMDSIEWFLVHGFYADMGRFAVKVRLPTQ